MKLQTVRTPVKSPYTCKTKKSKLIRRRDCSKVALPTVVDTTDRYIDCLSRSSKDGECFSHDKQTHSKPPLLATTGEHVILL